MVRGSAAQWYDTRVDLSVVMPTQVQWDAGGRWFRCDLREIAETGDVVKRRTASLRQAVEPLRHHCVKMVGTNPHSGRTSLRPIDCAQPHEAEKGMLTQSVVGLGNGTPS